VSRLYLFGATGGSAGFLLRGLVACVCLLPPTLLMGASLPAIARWLETTPAGVSSLGFLYNSNIAGAVFGALFAGFYLLRVFDMAVATYTAGAINAAVAAASFALSACTRHTQRFPGAAAEDGPRTSGAPMVYVAIALSGLCALGAQVVWTRLLSLLLGATVYTFSIILAVFLLGLWAGSGAGSLLARRIQYPRLLLAGCQLLLALSIAWTAYTLAYSLPYWPVDPWLSLNPWFNFEIDLVRCVWAIFPATILWGACFPLALASVAAAGQDPGRLSGGVYAANTAGAIVGALVFSLVLIPIAGTRVSEQILIGLSVATGVIAAAPVRGIRLPSLKLFAGGSAAAAVLGCALAASVADVPWEVVAYGRRVAPTIRAFDLYPQTAQILYRGEGISSSVVILERAGQRHFYVSGKAEASTAPLDMRLERMMGHVPALLHANPRSVLTVGFGAGVTAGSFVPYPELKRLVICELEPFIPPASTEFFGPQNNRVFKDPRTQVVYDDARHYVFTTNEKFDVITTDPIHPWVKGMSTLYSREYYELIKRRLNPGGVVAQWLPIYDSDADTVKIELATFFSVFPNGTVWSNFVNNDGYDLVLIGQPDGGRVNVDLLQQRLDGAGYSAVMASLGEVGFHSAVDLLATYAGRASDLQPYLANAQINQDLNMRLQYLAGLGLNSMRYPKIYKDILTYRRFPEGVITGSPGGRMDALRTLLRRGAQ
jgi:spermidine synthase